MMGTWDYTHCSRPNHLSVCQHYAGTLQQLCCLILLERAITSKDLIRNEFAADVISNIHCTVVPMPTWDDTFENVIKAFYFLCAVIVFEFFLSRFNHKLFFE